MTATRITCVTSPYRAKSVGAITRMTPTTIGPSVRLGVD
jgi:hypothetical protein